MATTTKLIATLLILSLFSLSPACNACGSCGSTPTPTPTTPTPTPAAPATPAPAKPKKCPLNTLKLGVCADVLGLVHAVLGNPPSGPKCCALIKGLADVEAAACLCTAIRANILGINLNVPVTLSLILSACQKEVPPGFKC